MQFLTVDYQAGQPAQDLTNFYNTYGAQGWALAQLDLVDSVTRRAIFEQMGNVEFLVVDYPTGKTPTDLSSDMNVYGVDGWQLAAVDLYRYDTRRAIMARGPGVGGGTGGAMTWVPYTGPPQSFNAQDLTRDGDWTMVANKATSDRPAPQPSGAEENLLPIWTATRLSARATYTVYNEWTLAQAGWIDKYGGDVILGNVGATHTITLSINGVVKDTFTAVPNVDGPYFHDITPILVMIGAVVRVTVRVTLVGNNLMYWDQQVGLFASAPVYCSLAQGSKDGAAASTTAYSCHLMFVPGTASPDWDVVAYGGAASGGGGSISEAPGDGNTYGRMNGAWNWVIAHENDKFDGGSF
jgi:hypothetical protein